MAVMAISERTVPLRQWALLALMLAWAGGAQAQVPPFWEVEWPRTDFDSRAVDFAEILSGGPPKDGIPAVDDPRFVPAAEEDGLKPREPVAVLKIGDAPARAYPYRYLIWHEIVNDTVGGLPVALTYCPLCGTIITYERTLPGVGETTFGTTGKLRLSNLIMYDRATESWWQQAEGRAIVGRLTGMRLKPVLTRTMGWQAYRAEFPDGLVMAAPGRSRPYGRNPYVGYDGSDSPFLYRGENPPHGISPIARVVAVGDRAWLLERVRKEGRIVEDGVILTWQPGMASALDTAEIGAGREIGAVRVQDAAGNDLLHDVLFAFAFHAFRPDGRWMLGR